MKHFFCILFLLISFVFKANGQIIVRRYVPFCYNHMVIKKVYHHRYCNTKPIQIIIKHTLVNNNPSNDENIIINDEKSSNNIHFSQMWKQTVWFHEDCYQLTHNDNYITLDNVATFLNEQINCNIIIYGYASKKHGSYTYNKILAAKRCKSVKSYLTNKYNINPSRITIIVKGTDTPEYYIDNWNQCVVIKAQ